jgi:hypothetical protein
MEKKFFVKLVNIYIYLLFVVRAAGLEPARPYGLQILSPVIGGSRDGTRTRKPLQARDFKSLVYTNSTTRPCHTWHSLAQLVAQFSFLVHIPIF